MKSLTDSIRLSSGNSIPCVGYGTWQTPDEEARTCVACALDAGYRHIDTANGYYNERGVGEAIRTSGIPRKDIFVTTKHWIVNRGYEKTIATAEESLRLLNIDYIDLYLIHWPCVAKTHDNWKAINADTWRGFEAMVKAGKIRSIGVSNFLPHHLEALMETAEIMPAVNQIEFHPGYTQMETVKWCQAHNIAVEAWSPLGCGAVLHNECLTAIAAKYQKSTAQLCIRYALQHGVIPLPKSVTPSRILDNTNVFDFEISATDMAVLDTMPQTGYSGYYPDDAPADALVAGE